LDETQSKVSIVMPVWNKIEYIDMMLDSIYNQLWDNIELIMVNDGATDGTREKLAEWEFKLIKRGYEVIILDQENQGIPSAVKTGLMQITGDYVCLVDCDDELDPEYVSIMADWLDNHQEDMWVACTYNEFKKTDGQHKTISTTDSTFISQPPNMMEKYLLSGYSSVIWIYLVRVKYFRECRVLETFITDIRSTQEPGYLMPLIIGNGRLNVIDRPLYNYNKCQSGTCVHKTASQAMEFHDLLMNMQISMINSLNISSLIKKKWCILAELYHKTILILILNNFKNTSGHITQLAKQALFLINTYFAPSPCLSIDHIIDKDFKSLTFAFEDCILKIKPQILPEKIDRIVCLGALGNYGRELIPKLIHLGYNLTDLWDSSASSTDAICDMLVSVPDMSSLTAGDIVLILPRKKNILDELLYEVKKGKANTVLYGFDIDRLISSKMYPQFYNDYSFIV